MSYQPGRHLVTTLHTNQNNNTQQHHDFRQLIDSLIQQHGLKKLGEVYHDFDPQGFTAVVCLSESHISVHTWPEHGIINFDIYLSNYQRNNDGTVDSIFTAFENFFGGTVTQKQIITR